MNNEFKTRTIMLAESEFDHAVADATIKLTNEFSKNSTDPMMSFIVGSMGVAAYAMLKEILFKEKEERKGE